MKSNLERLKEKYFDLEKLSEINPKDIIAFYYYTDTFYDYASEDMGMFYGIVYEKNEEVFWESSNPEIFDPVQKILDYVGDSLITCRNDGVFGIRVNKKYINSFQKFGEYYIFNGKYVLSGLDAEYFCDAIINYGENHGK